MTQELSLQYQERGEKLAAEEKLLSLSAAACNEKILQSEFWNAYRIHCLYILIGFSESFYLI